MELCTNPKRAVRKAMAVQNNSCKTVTNRRRQDTGITNQQMSHASTIPNRRWQDTGVTKSENALAHQSPSVQLVTVCVHTPTSFFKVPKRRFLHASKHVEIVPAASFLSKALECRVAFELV